MSARNDHPFNQNIILWCEVGLSNTLTIHKKSLYTVFDLLGDVGGLLDLFTLFVAFFLQKYNHSLFLFNATNNMFTFSTSGNSNSPPDTFSSFLFQYFCSCLPTFESNSQIKQPLEDSIGQDTVIKLSGLADEQTGSLNLNSPAEAISFCEEKISEELDVFKLLLKLHQLELLIKDESFLNFELRDRLNGVGRRVPVGGGGDREREGKREHFGVVQEKRDRNSMISLVNNL